MPEVLPQKPGSQVQARGQKAKGSLLKSLCLWWAGFSKCLGHPVPVKARSRPFQPAGTLLS